MLTEPTSEVRSLELLFEGTATSPFSEWPPTKSLSEWIPPASIHLATSTSNRRGASTSITVRARGRTFLP
jgi:hypothetical protein